MELREFFDSIGLRVWRVTGDEYTIFCPLHDDNDASLFVNPRKGKFICFGGCVSGSGGLRRLFEAIDPSNAPMLEYRFMSIFPFLLPPKEESSSRRPPIDIGLLPLADSSLPYFVERSISDETIAKFDIVYHKLFNAIIVPVGNGYVQRNLSSKPRYQNSPGLDVGRLLFPMERFILRDGRIFLVEGIFDAIRAHQEGITNCLSTLGGEIRDGQIRILGRFTRSVVLCPDRDTEGIKLAEKNTRTLQRYGYNISYMCPPTGYKDFAEAKILDNMPIKSYFELRFTNTPLNTFIRS